MLRIRLRRTGARKQPSYRVVVADSRAARDGRFVDYLGHYNPRTDPPTVVIDEEKAAKWIQQGAQPSEAVAHMLKKLGEAEKLGDPEKLDDSEQLDDSEKPDAAEESEE